MDRSDALACIRGRWPGLAEEGREYYAVEWTDSEGWHPRTLRSVMVLTDYAHGSRCVYYGRGESWPAAVLDAQQRHNRNAR